MRYKIKVGDIVTRTNGPYKDKPLRVSNIYNDLNGNERLSCTLEGNSEISVRGTRESFKFHKDYIGNPYDKSFKLTPCWNYMQDKYDKSRKEGDRTKQLYDWHHIRGLACHLNDCCKVEDIPDENLNKTVDYCKQMIDLYFDF